MAVTRIGSAINCVDADTVAGPLDIVAIHSDATTSATITANSKVIWSSAVKRTDPVQWRGDETLTVSVTGGGSITIYLRTH